LRDLLTNICDLINTLIDISCFRNSFGFSCALLFLDTLLGSGALLLNFIPANILSCALLLICALLNLFALLLSHILALLGGDLSGDHVTHLHLCVGAALLIDLPELSLALLLLLSAAGLICDCLSAGDDLSVADCLRHVVAHLAGLSVVLGHTLGGNSNSHCLLVEVSVAVAIARLSLSKGQGKETEYYCELLHTDY